MDDSPFRATVIGSSRCSVWREARPLIERKLANWKVSEFPLLTDLIEAVETRDDFADLVIVCQSWRDEYAAEDVKTALASLPVARWICVVGPWCESESRHGSRWPLALRVPLSSWPTRFANEIAVVQGRLPALAITAAREEAFAFDRQSPFPKYADSEPKPTMAIRSPDREWKSWMRDLCESGGWEEIAAEPETSPEVLILDLDPLTEATPAKIQSLKAQRPQSKIVGCLGLVYPEDRRELQAVGVDVLLSKLTPAAELLDAMGKAKSGINQGE